MKSLREILELLEQSLSGSKQHRRFRRKSQAPSQPETLEPRLLLTADVSDALYSSLSVDSVDSETPVENYLVAFTEAQDVQQLQQATNAVSVTESQFIDNAYMFNFGDGLTLQDAADLIADMDSFGFLHPDVPEQMVPFAVPNDPLLGDQWHLINTGQGNGVSGLDANVESVWDSYTGAGVTIGIVDDGFEHSHPDLAPNARTDIDYDWNGDDDDPTPPAGTVDNHGTSVGGVAGAKGNNGIGVSGASWDADLVGLRLIAGAISDQDIAEALTHQQDIIDIYNNSWGSGPNGSIGATGPQTLAALAQSAQDGRNGLGNIQVFAAGNGRLESDNVNYRLLQNSRHTIAIGALGNDGTRADYSTVGASLVVVAPSNGGTLGITTTDRTGTDGYSTTDYADDFGGTSSAAPLVSGVIALMLEANPDLTYRDVTNILINTAERVDLNNADWTQNGVGLWVNHEYGFGNVDAAAAVDWALNEPLLGEEQSFVAPTVAVNQALEDNGAAVTASYTVAAADSIAQLEYVELVFDADHGYVGDLEVILTSPSGTESLLAEVRTTDSATSYPNWVFTTTRNWGEESVGTWTVSVRDGADEDTGTFNSFQLRFYGSDAPGPIVVESGGTTRVEEFGLTDSVSVSLASQPTSNVVMDIAVQDSGEVAIDKTQLVFTPTNWQTPQVVTVSGVLDYAQDGNQLSNLVFSINDALSDDNFDNYSDVIVAVTTIDNDFNVPRKPVLTAPQQLPGITTPRFEWDEAQNAATYDLSVMNIRTGNVIQQISGVTRLDHTFTLPFFDGVYEATLTAFGSTGIQGPTSDPLVFAIGKVALSGVPTIIAPTGGAVLTTSTPLFEWTTASEAFTYEIQVVTTDNTLTQTVTPATGATTVDWQFAEPLAEGNATVWVRGLNALGQPGEWSAPSNFVINAFETPGKPTIIRPNVSVTDNAFPTFVWAAPGGETYQLWVGQTPEDPANGTASSLNNRVIHLRNHSFTDYTHFKSLDNGNYVAWVRSFNSAGEPSAWSDGVLFEVDVPIPARPAITQVDINDSRPTIQWDSTGEDFPPNSTFHLWVNNLTTGQSRVIQERELSRTSFTPDSSLAAGRYAAWVQVTSATGVLSSWSSRYDFDVNVEAPGSSSVLGPVPDAGETAIVTDKPTFSWATATAAATYELWVNNTTLGLSRIIHEKALTETSFTPEASLPQGAYKAWVRAINSAGEVGDWSLAYSFDLDLPGPAVPTITGPVAGQIGTVTTATPEITWVSLGGADTYNLELQTASDQQTVISETGLTEESYTADFRLNQTTYRVRVQAFNTAGEMSEFSEWYTFRIDVANPTTPVALTPDSTVISNTIQFTWTQESGNYRHEILVRDLLREETIVFQVSADAGGGGDDIASYTDELQNGTYRFWVRGFNSQGVSSGWSNPRAFIVDGDDLASLEVDSDLLLASLQMKSLELPAAEETEKSLQLPSEQFEMAEAVVTANVENSETDFVSEEDEALAAVLAELADPSRGLRLHEDLS